MWCRSRKYGIGPPRMHHNSTFVWKSGRNKKRKGSQISASGSLCFLTIVRLGVMTT